jgi:hypothetical protein
MWKDVILIVSLTIKKRKDLLFKNRSYEEKRFIHPWLILLLQIDHVKDITPLIISVNFFFGEYAKTSL